jgi:hypothetical protein
MHNIFTMPVILRFGAFKFVIYPKDHLPAHVHVLAPNAEAKVDSQSGKSVAVFGFSQKTVKRLAEITCKNRELLMEAWHEFQD